MAAASSNVRPAGLRAIAALSFTATYSAVAGFDAEHLAAGLEVGHGRPGLFHDARELRSEARAPRAANAREQAREPL